MKTRIVTVRLPHALAAQLDAEARERGVSKSDVVRERLEAGAAAYGAVAHPLAAIADVVGSIKGLPADLSRRRKHYLNTTRYGSRPRAR